MTLAYGTCAERKNSGYCTAHSQMCRCKALRLSTMLRKAVTFVSISAMTDVLDEPRECPQRQHGWNRRNQDQIGRSKDVLTQYREGRVDSPAARTYTRDQASRSTSARSRSGRPSRWRKRSSLR